VQGAKRSLKFGATIASSDACRAGKRTPIGGDGSHQAQPHLARAVSNQLDASRWDDQMVSNQNASKVLLAGSRRGRKEEGKTTATLGIGKAAAAAAAADGARRSRVALTPAMTDLGRTGQRALAVPLAWCCWVLRVSRLLRRHLILHLNIHYSAVCRPSVALLQNPRLHRLPTYLPTPLHHLRPTAATSRHLHRHYISTRPAVSGPPINTSLP
jgi:hypothetical protein